jgi:hypothetical protein
LRITKVEQFFRMMDTLDQALQSGTSQVAG